MLISIYSRSPIASGPSRQRTRLPKPPSIPNSHHLPPLSSPPNRLRTSRLPLRPLHRSPNCQRPLHRSPAHLPTSIILLNLYKLRKRLHHLLPNCRLSHRPRRPPQWLKRPRHHRPPPRNRSRNRSLVLKRFLSPLQRPITRLQSLQPPYHWHQLLSRRPLKPQKKRPQVLSRLPPRSLIPLFLVKLPQPPIPAHHRLRGHRWPRQR